MSEITTTIEDVNIVAYLSIRGFVAIPFIKEEAHDGKSRQIAWEIKGDVKEAISNLYANYNVGVREFCKMVGYVKKDMYDLKNMKVDRL